MQSSEEAALLDSTRMANEVAAMRAEAASARQAAETSELAALRREKKAILMEERRLRALLDLGKSEQHAKADLLAAQRA